MKIALIPPYSLLEHSSRTNYQLCLPQLLSNGNYFTKFYEAGRDPEQFVILDNGAAEGKAASREVLISNAQRLRVQEVVIPDVMGDKKGTIELAEEWYEEVIPPYEFEKPPYSFMFVLQGSTLMEVLECANWASQQPWISTFGIPRHLVTTLDDPFARVRIANTIQGHNYSKQIHFLGASSAYPNEVMFLSDPVHTNQSRVRGMDTSMPFNYAFAGKSLLDASVRLTEKVNRPVNYFYLNAGDFDSQCVEDNVEFFLQFHEQGVEAR